MSHGVVVLHHGRQPTPGHHAAHGDRPHARSRGDRGFHRDDGDRDVQRAGASGSPAISLMNGSTPVAGAVAYDAATQRATFTPDVGLERRNQLHRNGERRHGPERKRHVAGVVDLHHGHRPTATGCPCSIWAASALPGTPAEADSAAVEVGTKFRSDVAGTGHRRAVLQGHRQHRHPRRAPVDAARGERSAR